MNQLVQAMQQEPAFLERHATLAFETILLQCQWAGPREFDQNSPYQRGDLQPAKKRL
jgi:hypothetical protein